MTAPEGEAGSATEQVAAGYLNAGRSQPGTRADPGSGTPVLRSHRSPDKAPPFSAARHPYPKTRQAPQRAAAGFRYIQPGAGGRQVPGRGLANRPWTQGSSLREAATAFHRGTRTGSRR